MRAALSSLALFIVLVSRSLAAQDRQVLHGSGEVRGLPFSSAVRVGNMLYLSGQIGNVPGTSQLADTGIAGQTRQALENINASARVRGELARAGGEVHGVPHGHQGLRGYERGVRDVFPKDPPARSTVAGSEPALGARVEIECLAVAG